MTLAGSKPCSSTAGWNRNNRMIRHPRPKTWENWSLELIELREGTERLNTFGACGDGKKEKTFEISTQYHARSTKRGKYGLRAYKRDCQRESYRILQSLPRTERTERALTLVRIFSHLYPSSPFPGFYAPFPEMNQNKMKSRATSERRTAIPKGVEQKKEPSPEHRYPSPNSHSPLLLHRKSPSSIKIFDHRLYLQSPPVHKTQPEKWEPYIPTLQWILDFLSPTPGASPPSSARVWQPRECIGTYDF